MQARPFFADNVRTTVCPGMRTPYASMRIHRVTVIFHSTVRFKQNAFFVKPDAMGMYACWAPEYFHHPLRLEGVQSGCRFVGEYQRRSAAHERQISSKTHGGSNWHFVFLTTRRVVSTMPPPTQASSCIRFNTYRLRWTNTPNSNEYRQDLDTVFGAWVVEKVVHMFQQHLPSH